MACLALHSASQGTAVDNPHDHHNAKRVLWKANLPIRPSFDCPKDFGPSITPVCARGAVGKSNHPFPLRAPFLIHCGTYDLRACTSKYYRSNVPQYCTVPYQ